MRQPPVSHFVAPVRQRWPPAVLGFLLFLLPATLAAADQAVNTICPVSGKPVDATIPAIVVTVGKGERAKRVLIGVADRAAAEKVKANPALYVEAAKANHKAP